MSFVNACREIKKCVVAIVKTFYTAQEREKAFPDILGTGFFCSATGIVCTCKHVLDAINAMPKPAGFQGYPAQILSFADLYDGPGVCFLNFDIEQAGDSALIGNTDDYLGPNPPDLAFLLASVTQTPYIRFAESPLQEGEFVAFTGFPMGTETLTAPGWLQQLSPTLHGGLVSVVLPHHSSESPHGFLVHSNTQGGASGSPIFRDTGEVVGMVHSTLFDLKRIQIDGGQMLYPVPTSQTSLTGCVPSDVIKSVLKIAEVDQAVKRNRPSYMEQMSSREKQRWEPGTSFFTQFKGL